LPRNERKTYLKYISLIEENQLDIKEQRGLYGVIDLYDLPF